MEPWSESSDTDILMFKLKRYILRESSFILSNSYIQNLGLTQPLLWSAFKKYEPTAGVEPTIFWLEVKRVNHYATRADFLTIDIDPKFVLQTYPIKRLTICLANLTLLYSYWSYISTVYHQVRFSFYSYRYIGAIAIYCLSSNRSYYK